MAATNLYIYLGKYMVMLNNQANGIGQHTGEIPGVGSHVVEPWACAAI